MTSQNKSLEEKIFRVKKEKFIVDSDILTNKKLPNGRSNKCLENKKSLKNRIKSKSI